MRVIPVRLRTFVIAGASARYLRLSDDSRRLGRPANPVGARQLVPKLRYACGAARRGAGGPALAMDILHYKPIVTNCAPIICVRSLPTDFRAGAASTAAVVGWRFGAES